MLSQEMPGVLFAEKVGGRGAEGGSGRWGGADDRGPWGRSVTRESTRSGDLEDGEEGRKRDRNPGSSHPGAQPGNGVNEEETARG